MQMPGGIKQMIRVAIYSLADFIFKIINLVLTIYHRSHKQIQSHQSLKYEMIPLPPLLQNRLGNIFHITRFVIVTIIF